MRSIRLIRSLPIALLIFLELFAFTLATSLAFTPAQAGHRKLKTRVTPTPSATVAAPTIASEGGLPAAGVYLNSDGSPLLPLLQNAQTSIDIEIYTMNDPTVRELLRSAQKRHVRLRILKEPKPLGDPCHLFRAAPGEKDGSSEADCAAQIAFVSEVRAAGGVFEPFNKAALCPNGGGKAGTLCYEHGKIALVDGVSLISTGNFDRSNLCIDGPAKCNRDFSVISRDSAVYSTLESIFEADLRAQPYDVASLIPAKLRGVLTVSPLSLQPIVDLIGSARQTLEIEAQYLTDPQLLGAVEQAARNGVQVSVTVASACAFGRPAASEVKKITSIYGTFDRLGISSEFFNASNRINGSPGYMHAKVIAVDSERVWIGSVNGSTGSLTENREFGLILDDPTAVAKTLGILRADHESPSSESWQQSLDCAKD